ncbi:hypothetical protein DITRI_Ditri02bG0044800 [Diplodiscus trichospermus]
MGNFNPKKFWGKKDLVLFIKDVFQIGLWLALYHNLLHLYGFCITPDERLLCLSLIYMPNQSDADRSRVKVNGVLRESSGYLHNGCQKSFVQCIVILLRDFTFKFYHSSFALLQHCQLGYDPPCHVRTLNEEARLEMLVDRDLTGSAFYLVTTAPSPKILEVFKGPGRPCAVRNGGIARWSNWIRLDFENSSRVELS